MPGENKKRENYIIAAMLVILIAAATVFLVSTYIIVGPMWDLIAHYFNGRSLLNPMLYSSGQAIVNYVTVQGRNIYYEGFRAPISGALFAVLSPIPMDTILLYLIVAYVALLIVIYKFSAYMQIDALMSFAVLLNPYVLSVTFIGNGAEILSILFVLLSIGLLAKKSPLAGLTLGLASLGKYPSLILIPCIFLLREPRKILKGIALEFLAVAPWLLFNFILTGHPLLSYMQAFHTALSGAPYSPIYAKTLVTLFIYPAVLSAILLIMYIKDRRQGRRKPLKTDNGSGNKKLIIGVFLVLSIVQFLIIGMHYDVFTQVRYGYLVAVMALVAALYFLNEEQRISRNARLVVFIASLLFIAYFTYQLYSNSAYASYYNPNSNLSVYHNASVVLNSLGYANCRIISNSWIYMRYIGYDAYMPYLNGTSSSYPILMFKNVGSTQLVIGNTSGDRQVYDSSNFTVLVPYAYRCYTN